VLKNMRRPAHQEKTLDRIKAWKKQVPDLTIRSTFIVGFPGETEEDFQLLLDWRPKPNSTASARSSTNPSLAPTPTRSSPTSPPKSWTNATTAS